MLRSRQHRRGVDDLWHRHARHVVVVAHSLQCAHFSCATWLDVAHPTRLPPHCAVIQIGPAVFALVAIFCVPESPRFHLGRGDEQACLDFLIQYHGNGEETELVRFEFEEMKDTLRKEREATQYGWSILWATRANRRRTALVLWIGFCQCLSGQAIITLCVASFFQGSVDPASASHPWGSLARTARPFPLLLLQLLHEHPPVRLAASGCRQQRLLKLTSLLGGGSSA